MVYARVNAGPLLTGTANESRIDMAENRKAISKNLWIVALVVLLGLAAATFYTLSRPPQYQSTATLLLNPSLPSASAPYPQTEMAANLADIYTGYIGSPAFE